MADWTTLNDKIRTDLADNHQRQALGLLALAQAQEAIGQLASLGYSYDLTVGPTPGPVEFPKMLYRDSPQGLTTTIAEDAKAQANLVKDGWRLEQVASAKKP